MKQILDQINYLWTDQNTYCYRGYLDHCTIARTSIGGIFTILMIFFLKITSYIDSCIKWIIKQTTLAYHLHWKLMDDVDDGYFL